MVSGGYLTEGERGGGKERRKRRDLNGGRGKERRIEDEEGGYRF